MERYQVKVDGHSYVVEIEKDESATPSPAPLITAPAEKPAAPAKVVAAPVPSQPVVQKAEPAAGGSALVAPMQGKIVCCNVTVGDMVKAGDVIAVLEAMKMENEIMTDHSGKIIKVGVSAGQTVEAGDLIVQIG